MDGLFDLIHSLSSTEKRYFKLYTKPKGKAPIYLQIYEAINAMDEYSEVSLRKKVLKVTAKHKINLCQVILEAMREYGRSKKTVQIKNHIFDARFLYQRRLYKLSKKRLEEAKKLAHEMDDQLSLLEINREERNLYRTNTNKKDLKELESLQAEKNLALKNIEQELTCHDMYDDLYRKYVLPDEVKQRDLEADYLIKLEEQSQLKQSPFALRKLFQSKALYYQLINNKEQTFHYFKEVVKWWDAHSELKIEAMYWYIADISNLIYGGLETEKYEEVKIAIERLESIKSKTQHEEKMIFQCLHMNKLRYQFLTSNFMDISSIPKIEAGLKKYKKYSITNKLTLLDNVAILFFLREEFGQCFNWCEKIKHVAKNHNHKYDIQRAGRLRQLICSLEMNSGITEYDFDNLYRVTQRFFKKNVNYHEDNFDNELLGYLKKICNTTISDKKQKYQDLTDFFKGFQRKNPRKKWTSFEQEVLIWANSRIQGKTISEYYREKIKKKP